MPDVLDLTWLRGQGRQDGEVDFPVEEEEAADVVIDETIVSQLVDMGFPYEGCKKVTALSTEISHCHPTSHGAETMLDVLLMLLLLVLLFLYYYYYY